MCSNPHEIITFSPKLAETKAMQYNNPGDELGSDNKFGELNRDRNRCKMHWMNMDEMDDPDTDALDAYVHQHHHNTYHHHHAHHSQLRLKAVP